MAIIHAHCDVVPPGDIRMLAQCMADNSLESLIAHAIGFGIGIAPKLNEGAKMATGNDGRGYYHPIDITLREKMHRVTNIGLNRSIEIPDIPIYSQLETISYAMRLGTPDAAIARLLYWLWVASQYTWMYLPIYIMDHQNGEWRKYQFPPLFNARNDFYY